MPTSKKADLVVSHNTRRAAKVSTTRSYWSITPPPGCHRINWGQPMPDPLSGVWGWTRGRAVREHMKTLGDTDTVDAVAALASAWRQRAAAETPAPTRMDYQQLRNKKAKNKWACSGRAERAEHAAARAAQAAEAVVAGR